MPIQLRGKVGKRKIKKEAYLVYWASFLCVAGLLLGYISSFVRVLLSLLSWVCALGFFIATFRGLLSYDLFDVGAMPKNSVAYKHSRIRKRGRDACMLNTCVEAGFFAIC